MHRTMIALLAALVAACWIPQQATAAKLSGVELTDTVTVDGHRLVLNGLGLRKKAIFKVYVAGLYLPARQSDPRAILQADAPRRLIMEFVRNVGSEPLVEAWNECRDNNSPNATGEVERGFQQLNSWMAEVGAGDQLVFTYLPGSGTSVEVRGSAKGNVAGRPFADALFACWIGDFPPSADFKNGLLGR